MNKIIKNTGNFWTGTIVVIAILISVFAPIINHIVYCFQNQEYVLLLAGTIVFPVGWFHGLGLWFGFW